MDNPRYDPDFEYDDYEVYPDNQVTSVGLPPSQLALIIGVNAVISLIISVAVVLIANRQVVPGDIATPAAQVSPGSTVDGQAPAPVEAEDQPAPSEVTPVQRVTYVVESGDTLGLIAQKFSVSLFDLMTVNGLTNQDFIQVGQELIIPLGGVATTTPTFTPVAVPSATPLPFDPPTPLPTDAAIPPEPAATVGPSPTPTSTPTGAASPTPLPTSTPPPFDQIDVAINEVIGAGELAQETLIILNKGAGISLRDWKLEGSSLGIFVFPDIFLFSGGSIRVHTAAGQNTPSDLFLNQGEPAWSPGGAITLRDAAGKQISRFEVPAR